MLEILKHRDFARLFAAQVVALIGTGLLTVALGLLAYDLAGPAAGAVLGTAYAVKMVAYVGLSPITGALVARLPRRAVLIGMDVVRMGVALCLPFVETVGQVYGLIFLLQAASATFTPTFQATIPDILEDEGAYTRALSLSRVAYDLENLLSPMLAGLLLLVMSYHGLFVGTAFGFLGSALLVWQARIPQRGSDVPRPFRERVTRGIWIYLNTPRLRGLLAFNMGAAAVGAFVLVNTVVMVRETYGLGESALAVAMAAFGAGSMAAALILPGVLERLRDRRVMACAAVLLTVLTLAHGLWMAMQGPLAWGVFLGVWAVTGALYSAVLTPSGRLLRRSAHAEDRPAVFTAQFALSHLCWLVTYPLAGYGATYGSLWGALVLMGAIAAASTALALWLWRGERVVEHVHPDLPEDHPHILEHGGRRHRHAVVIDDEHRVWPTQG
ncbi:MFS transporter [Shimia aestuarii]|uniref:Predicted arabinose efflux permease, MFS family n=1 Tax=Shimia aestuarii TaxID=254406 RepID=A0A1I4MW00_9RHOB|nr:MFS transporter [Shimia aestuarii]SFM07277.1 Predicted arabinose efflux permease, MFS family [Shimia aestuarii]